MGYYYPGQPNRSYWIERMWDQDHALRKAEDIVVRDINQTYDHAFNEIRREINTFYTDYARDNHITLQQAQRQLTPIEYSEYRQRIRILERVYRDTQDENILREINALGSRREVTRLQALSDAINEQLIRVSDNVQMTLEDHLHGAYNSGYNNAFNNLGQEPVINTRAVEEIIRYPFQGAMFSDRIWRNKNQLLNWINDDLTKGIIRGDSIQKMGKSLRERCNVTKYQAERLVRTESCQAYTRGTLDGYKDSMMVDAYEVLTAGDDRMCGSCSSKSGEVIPLNEAIPGNNCPPFHPRKNLTVDVHVSL